MLDTTADTSCMNQPHQVDTLGLDSALRESLDRALAGELLSPSEGYKLMDSQEAGLSAVQLAANSLRQRGRGNRTTYSRKVFIPLTNMCRDRCGYCTFVKAPGQPEAHTMTPAEVLNVARQGKEMGCKEALFSLGDHPEWRHPEAAHQLKELGYSSTVEYLAAMCRLVFDETGLLPHTNCGVLAEDELQLLKEVTISMGLMLENVSYRLLQRGGPHFGCDSKAPSMRLETLAHAGELYIAMTTGILIGIGETPHERVDSLLAIRDLHLRYGNIQEVIIQNFRAKPTTRMHGCAEPATLDMLRTIAVARLILGEHMNIQAPPNLNSSGCQDYLLAGINDWGGISPVTIDHINPEAPWPQITHLRQLTENVGLQLWERLALYPEYVHMTGHWLPETFSREVHRLTDDDGYVKEALLVW